MCGCVGGGAKGMKVWLFMDKNLSLGLKMAGNMENSKVGTQGRDRRLGKQGFTTKDGAVVPLPPLPRPRTHLVLGQ